MAHVLCGRDIFEVVAAGQCPCGGGPSNALLLLAIVADRDGALAVDFVRKIIKPRVDDVLDKGHCKPIFEWRRGQPEKIEPPPIKTD